MNNLLSNLEKTAHTLTEKAAQDDEDIYSALHDDSAVEIDQLATLYDDGDAFVLGLERAKAEKNLEKARIMAMSDPSTESKAQLRKIGNDLLFVRQYELEVSGREEQLTHVIKRRRAEDEDREIQRRERELLLEGGDDDNVPAAPGLRRRTTPGDASISEDASLQTKLQVDENEQDDIANDVLSLVRRMKQNANDLNAKLNKDNDVVRDTAAALESSSSKMGTVGQKMSQYQRTTAIGYFFYIKAVVFMVLTVAGAMIIIRLFPKW